MGPQILSITLHFCHLTGGPCETYKLNGLLAKSGKEALDILGPEFGVLRISENFEALHNFVLCPRDFTTSTGARLHSTVISTSIIFLEFTPPC